MQVQPVRLSPGQQGVAALHRVGGGKRPQCCTPEWRLLPRVPYKACE